MKYKIGDLVHWSSDTTTIYRVVATYNEPVKDSSPPDFADSPGMYVIVENDKLPIDGDKRLCFYEKELTLFQPLQ